MTAGAGPSPVIVKRLRVYTEPAGAATFAVDHTGTLGDFTDVPFAETSGMATLTEETHNPLTAQQNVLGFQEKVVGKRSWSLTFTTPLAPTGVSAAQGTTQVQGAIGLMLKALMGGEFLGRGTVAATGGWANSATGDVATGANLRAGGSLSWADSNGVRHAREIESVTSNTVTLKVGLPGAPASGDALHAGATYYWTQDPDTSLQFILEGEEQNQRYVLLGGQGTVAPTLPLDGTIPTLQWTITGPDWLMGDDAAGSAGIDAVALGTATHSNYNPITGHVGRLLVQTVGTATYSGATVDASEVSFQTGMAYTAVPSPSGVNGVLRHRLTRASDSAPVSGSFSTYYTGYTWRDHLSAKTDLYVAYQTGVSGGGIVVLSGSTAQVTDVADPDASGIAGQTIQWMGRLDTDTVEGTASDLGRSPQRYHLL